MDRTDERGQAVPLAIGVTAVAAAFLAGLGVVGSHLHDAARARTAADAAALAGATAGAGEAHRLARANGATLVSFAGDATTVTVEVRVGRAHARARASAFVLP